MAKLGSAFNAQAIRPADPDGGSNLPIGLIKCLITGNDVVKNNGETGHHIVLMLQGADGLGKGMVGKYRINLFHNNAAEPAKSAQTREIAAGQLSAVCHATGVYDLGPDGDLDMLTGKPLIAVVESQNDAAHPDRTNIVGVADLNGDKPGQPGVKVRPREQGPAPIAAAPQAAWAPPPSAAAVAPAPVVAAAGWGPTSAPAVAAAPAAAGWVPNAAAQAAVPGAAAPAAAGVVPQWAQPR